MNEERRELMQAWGEYLAEGSEITT